MLCSYLNFLSQPSQNPSEDGIIDEDREEQKQEANALIEVMLLHTHTCDGVGFSPRPSHPWPLPPSPVPALPTTVVGV